MRTGHTFGLVTRQDEILSLVELPLGVVVPRDGDRFALLQGEVSILDWNIDEVGHPRPESPVQGCDASALHKLADGVPRVDGPRTGRHEGDLTSATTATITGSGSSSSIYPTSAVTAYLKLSSGTPKIVVADAVRLEQ